MPHEELPHEWTPDERMRVAAQLLGMIQLDVPAGRYGLEGRPNVTSVLHILHADRDTLNQHRDELAAVLEEE